MDDMQRYREIGANADPEDPAKALIASIAVSYDQAIVEAIRLERSGKTGALDRTLRKMGLTETADLLASDSTAQMVRALLDSHHCQNCRCIHEPCGYVIGSHGCERTCGKTVTVPR